MSSRTVEPQLQGGLHGLSFKSTMLIARQLRSKLPITDALGTFSRRALGPSSVLQMSRQQPAEVGGSPTVSQLVSGIQTPGPVFCQLPHWASGLRVQSHAVRGMLCPVRVHLSLSHPVRSSTSSSMKPSSHSPRPRAEVRFPLLSQRHMHAAASLCGHTPASQLDASEAGKGAPSPKAL